MGRSLAGRLLLASALLLPVFLGLAGYGLESAFRRALRAGEYEQLKAQSYLILGAAELEGRRIVVSSTLSEPRYAQLGSGLYAWLRGAGTQGALGAESWRSASALLLEIPPPERHLGMGESDFGPAELGAEVLFRYRVGLAWEGEDGEEVPFVLEIWHSREPYLAQLAGYRGSLLVSGGLLAGILLALQFFILRWGLGPLRGLANDLARVERGEVERLAGEYPREVRGVTENLNHLLASEQGRRERYRNTLSNLAHSLKTPLSVLRGALESPSPEADLRELAAGELERMEEIVAHQLSRAQRRGERPLAGSAAIAPVVERLCAALAKVYRERAPRFEVRVAAGLEFRGDEGDLMEMLGNLLDNCCKYGGQHIAVVAGRDGAGLRIDVSDDGPGIAEDERMRILERGARADRSAAGQGIGLSVVQEIATSYGGNLEIGSSARGGASFLLRFA
jgi:two-component system sensor histidine kinase PhoQ